MEELQSETRMLLVLMRRALHKEWNKEIVFDPDCNLEKLRDMIQRQSLAAMVYPVLKQQKEEPWGRLKAAVKPLYDKNIHCGLIQEYEIQNLLDGMERDGVDCLPMKGWIMREYYPEPQMRSMGDFDVLIRKLDSDAMRKWMEQRGYKAVKIYRAFHDEYSKPPCMYVELHRSLLDKSYLEPDEIRWLEKQEKAFWNPENLVPGKKHQYQLTDELFYVHHISHFQKHFTYSGAGIRHLADIYLLLQKKGHQLDWAYIDRQMEQLHLLAFSKKVRQMAECCFAGQELDPETTLVVKYLTEAGVYGGTELHENLEVLERGGESFGRGRARSILQRTFPPLEKMSEWYRPLRRCPWLLPFYWIMRIGRIVLKERGKIQRMVQCQTEEKYKAIKEVYRAAGIAEDRDENGKETIDSI